jgi:hypothetical protein
MEGKSERKETHPSQGGKIVNQLRKKRGFLTKEKAEKLAERVGFEPC